VFNAGWRQCELGIAGIPCLPGDLHFQPPAHRDDQLQERAPFRARRSAVRAFTG
jgi:hypothetical protein